MAGTMVLTNQQIPMSFFSLQNTFTKILLITGLTFIIYSYLARIIPIYFFWESGYTGWMIALVGVIGLFLTWIKRLRVQKKKTVLPKILIGIISFLLLLQAILLIVLPRTDAYKAAKAFIRGNENIRKELGSIKGWAVIPIGSISVSTVNQKTTGQANLVMIVKGENRFRRYVVNLVKDVDSDWKVYEFH